MRHRTRTTASRPQFEAPKTSLKAKLPDPCYVSIVTAELAIQLSIRTLPDDGRSVPDPWDKP